MPTGHALFLGIRKSWYCTLRAVVLASVAVPACSQLTPFETVPTPDGAFFGDWHHICPSWPDDRVEPCPQPDSPFGFSCTLPFDPTLPAPTPITGANEFGYRPDGPQAKEGMLQGINFTSTWLSRGGKKDMGSTDFELNTTLALPFPTEETPLVLVPSFASHYLDGPSKRDMPPQVYDAFLEVHWMGHVTPEFGFDLSVTPGLYSDFNQSDSNALRVGAGALGEYTLSPTTKLGFGVLYLNRDDIKLLPAGGVTWIPDEDTRLEFLFPTPKFSFRYFVDGDVEWWWHVGGELGGGAWAISRLDGSRDVASDRDLRLLAGLERKVAGGLQWQFEIGYVFDRRIHFRNDSPNLGLDDTFLIRAGVTY